MPALPNWGEALNQGAGATHVLGRLGHVLQSAVVTGAAANTAITVTGVSPGADDIVSVVEMRSGLVTFKGLGRNNVGTIDVSAYGAPATTGGAGTNPGLATEDRLVSVHRYSTNATITTMTNDTPLYTISAANELTTTDTTDASTHLIIVTFEDMSVTKVDRTSIAKITAKNQIKLTSATTGSKLLVLWTKSRPEKYA